MKAMRKRVADHDVHRWASRLPRRTRVGAVKTGPVHPGQQPRVTWRRTRQPGQPSGVRQSIRADRQLSEIGGELRIALTAFAARPRVLVAVDFDGTLAPLVHDPLQARAVRGGLEALRDVAALGGVTAAVVSGRDLATLETLTAIGPAMASP